jgi:protein-disulfide isomerase
MSEMQEQQDQGVTQGGSWVNAIPPKTLLIGGVVSGILIVCTIGFFILLGMKLSGSSNEPTVYPTPGGAVEPEAPKPAGKPAAVTSEDHVLGPADAKVTLIEYSDFQCPFCQRFHPTTQQLVNEYKGKIRLVFRHFPLNSIHPQAQKAAEASECVASLKGNEAFWKYADLLFKNQSSLGDANYATWATQVGVNKGAFQSCLSSGKFAGKVSASESEGASVGVQGTPATFVIAADGSSELMGGALPLEQAKAYVERALNK